MNVERASIRNSMRRLPLVALAIALIAWMADPTTVLAETAVPKTFAGDLWSRPGSDLGFRLRPFSFFLWSVTSARLSQLAQPDWDLLGFGRGEKLVGSTRAESEGARDSADR